MTTSFRNMIRAFSTSVLVGFLSACGGSGDFEPNYDDTAMPPERRVEGELAFSSPSLMKMAQSFRIAGDYTNAIRLYQRAATESPRHVTSRIALGQIYQRLGSTDGATTYFRQVLELEPENTEAQLGLGQMLVGGENSFEAIEYLEKAAEKSPDNYRVYNSIGLAYDLEGLHEQAQLAYGRGLSKKPDHISLLNNLALSLAFQDEFAPSIRLLSKAVNLDYSQTTAQQNLIMVYALSGEDDAARTMARSSMTPEEIENAMYRYNWLRGLSSKRRAKAVFLNLNFFPDEEGDIPEVEQEFVKTQPGILLDPKRKMLDDILNSENEPEEVMGDQAAAVLDVPVPQVAEEVEPEVIPDPEEMMVQNIVIPSGDYYHLQLGSYISESDVNIDWRRLKRLAPDLLSDQQIEVKKITTASDQERFRLFVGNYDNFSAAQQQCEALENNKVPCLVSKVSNSGN